MARHPRLPVVYAVNELPEGTVSAFALPPDGALPPDRGLIPDGGSVPDGGLAPLGTWPTGGAEPCHLAVTADGTRLLVANYASGNVASFALGPDGRPTRRTELDQHTGAGPHPERQTGPHAHQVTPDGDRVIVVDLGADTVLGYRPGQEATVLAALPPGTGPRHVAFGPGGTAYLVGELAGTVTAFAVGPTRSGSGWQELGTVPASGTAGGFPAEIAVAGDFLYVANRGPDTISVFSLDDKVPRLIGEVSTGGAWPRHFVLIERFLYVANQRSDTVVVFRVDPVTGLPIPTGSVLATPAPACVLPV